MAQVQDDHEHGDHVGHTHGKGHLPRHGPRHGHAHGHSHGHGDGKIGAAVAVNLILTAAQIVGGIAAGSVALIADALHNLSDALALVVAFAARRIARRPATPAMSFGFQRAEVIAALVNYVALIVISVWLGYEAVVRLFHPPEVTGWIVVLLAGIALVINTATAALTFALAKESMNIRAAFLHNASDAATSLAVIIGGVLIMAYDWRLVDPLLTLLISIWILVHALVELRPVIGILMLAAPPDRDVGVIRARIEADPAIEDVHHLHIWQIDEKRNSLEAHLVMAEDADAIAVVARIKALVRDEFDLSHATLEVETRAGGCAGTGCVQGLSVAAGH